MFVEQATDIDPENVLDGRKRIGDTKTQLAVDYLADALRDNGWHEKKGLEQLAPVRGCARRGG